jgi:transposase
MLVGQRTQAINALRGHAAEFGVIAAKGSGNVDILLSALTDHAAIPDMAKAMFEQMGRHVTDLDVKIQAIDRQLLEQHKANEVSQRLAAIPGIGPITAITMALSVNPANFESGRHFAAWLGQTPKEHSTGGKHRLGRISKAGNERLRQLLVVGAMAVLRFAISALSNWEGMGTAASKAGAIHVYVLRAIPVMRATVAITPRPAALASAAAKRRRLRSSSTGSSNS